MKPSPHVDYPATVAGSRHAPIIQANIDTVTFSRLPDELRTGRPTQAVPVLSTQGINEVQTTSNLLESSQLQDQKKNPSELFHTPRVLKAFRSHMNVLGLEEVEAQHRDLDITRLDA